MDMVARKRFGMNCDNMNGINEFRLTLHEWLKANELPPSRDNAKSAYYTQYQDDTEEGVYYDDGSTNTDLVMEWYFETMAAASDRVVEIRKKGIQCMKKAFPDKCLKTGEWADNFDWTTIKPMKKTGDALVDFFMGLRRDTETEPETIEAKPKKYMRS